ncbi:uncharacterized protein LOC141773627 isoform X2 [Sebastes fasciatus]|uniref:uncharacterized protein LOC141773627 isoform X2 n=1 Tax=Sebastes fasciatus TaxID=394691 RepID=UPI003D9F9E07
MEAQATEKDEKVTSVSSSKYTSSSKSSVASAAAKARAKAEAARTRVTFTQKELKLKKQRAKLDLEKATLEVDLEALELETAAAAANAEAEVLEAAAGTGCEDMRSAKSSVSPQAIRQRTEAYLEHQAQVSFKPATPLPVKAPPLLKEATPLTKQEAPELTPAYHCDVTSTRDTQQSEYLPAPEHQTHLPKPPSSHPQNPQSSFKTYLEQGSPSFRQASYPNSFTRNNTQDSSTAPAANMVDFAKYLARRELVTTGLTKFDDQPESYRAWEFSFLNATQDLELTASEELSLLVKWLGKESSEHVKRIRAVHITNPQAALELSWTRLQECYATPEVIESALFKRLDSFPHLTSKDNIKLRELSDLLLELLSAKEDGYLPGLSYLDTPRGINPIVEKLPQGLQEKWLFAGSHYKEQYRVSFPPFSFFGDFVRRQAKARNDPSFVLTNSNRSHYLNERPTARNDGVKTTISVKMTDVSATADSSSLHRSSTDRKNSTDLAKFCPLHDTSHPLEKCRAFKMKPLTERKTLLKEHRRCYRCCSATHMARECPVELKCNECESNQHCTAMHPDTTGSPAVSPATESDTEQQNSSPPEITSRCTEVCGEGLPARSCAKICLVRVFPQGQRERSVKMYAVLDDQSNCSLAGSEFFQLFDVNGSVAPYLMRTCAGTTEMTGRKAAGFQIEAMNGEVCLDLPPLIECNEIMSNRSEIPSPEVARSHAHLRSVVPYIPEIDPEAQILILLGRDLIRVHKVRQQINGPYNAPFAQRLDLGWVIVGKVCIDSAYKPTASVFKTNVLQNGRPSFLTPCQNHISVKERVGYGGEHRHCTPTHLSNCPASGVPAKDKLGQVVLVRTKNDNKPALSFEDETFLEIMQAEVQRDEQNYWIANRSVPASTLTDTMWFTGPEFLHKPHQPETHESFKLVDPETAVNVRPVVPVSTDPSSPMLLMPAMLLTQKPGVLAPAGSFYEKDLFNCQRKQVQPLANEFWPRWRSKYLHTLQPRCKWHTARRNLEVGDIVLLKQSQAPRNECPMGLVTSTLPSSDGQVRKIEFHSNSMCHLDLTCCERSH